LFWGVLQFDLEQIVRKKKGGRPKAKVTSAVDGMGGGEKKINQKLEANGRGTK